MTKIKEVLEALTAFAPAAWKEDFDHVGLICGNAEKAVTRVLVALDVTEETVAEAVELGAELIVSHHPLFFQAAELTVPGRAVTLVRQLDQLQIASIAMHTNFDSAPGGVNDRLAAAIGLNSEGLLFVKEYDAQGRPIGCGRFGTVETTSLADYAVSVKNALHCRGVRYLDAGVPVRRVAVVSGGGGFMIEAAIRSGCDTLVSGDFTYDMCLKAKSLGLNLIDAGHYHTEQVICPVFVELIRAACPELVVSLSRCVGDGVQFA